MADERVFDSGTRLFIEPDGIVRAVPPRDLVANEACVAELLEVGRELQATHGRAALIYDCRPMRSITKSARQQLVADAPQYLTALALLMRSAINRAAANAVLRVVRVPIPVRVFGDEADARRWLKSL
ncbi:MAG: hypothetical protein KC503_32885 [Myxococcales bacterium]|nr:hypothetical protein [Myxococcales bacterium]